MILLDKGYLKRKIQGLELGRAEDIIKKMLWTRILKYRCLMTVTLSVSVDE